MANLFGRGKRRRAGIVVAIGLGREGPPPPPAPGGRSAEEPERADGMHMGDESSELPAAEMVRKGLQQLAEQGKPWAAQLLERFEGLLRRAPEGEELAGTEETGATEPERGPGY